MAVQDKPRLYIVCGLPFAGKSTLVRELVRQRACRVVDVDVINTERGVGIAGAAITVEDWEASFAIARTQVITALMAEEAIAYDGHSFTRSQRDDLRTLARSADADVTLIFVDVPESVARARLRANRDLSLRHDVPDALFEQAIKLLEPPDEAEEPLVYDCTVPLDQWVAALL